MLRSRQNEPQGSERHRENDEEKGRDKLELPHKLLAFPHKLL